MSILVDKSTRLLVQGITGKEGSYHAQRSAEYGANLVAGVTPGKGGQNFNTTVPVYNTVQQAVDETSANASLIFVPPAFAADAIVESIDAGIEVIACITEGIPTMDMVPVKHALDPTAPELSLPEKTSKWESCQATSTCPVGLVLSREVAP